MIDPAREPQDCQGKEPYKTAGLARKVLRRRVGRAKSKGNSPNMVAYRCPHCGSYHIGTNPRTVRIVKRRTREGHDFKTIR